MNTYNGTLHIFRGLPGSGKSTAARKLSEEKNIPHVESDMFFMVDGTYVFDGSKIAKAHAWCSEKVRMYMDWGWDVIISNTFTLPWEIEPYFEMAIEFNYQVIVTEMGTQYASIHNIPTEVFNKMKTRFVPIQLMPHYDHVRYTRVDSVSI